MPESANNTNSTDVWIYVVIGFTSLGLLIGSIAGLSSAELTLPLFGFLFAFAGGSVITFMGKIPKPSIGLASIALASFCLAALITLYVGLYIKVNEILFINPKQTISASHKSAETTPLNNIVTQQGYRGVLRTGEYQTQEEYLKNEITFGRMNLTDACKKLSESSQYKGDPSND